jgi:hypothetical protein
MKRKTILFCSYPSPLDSSRMNFKLNTISMKMENYSSKGLVRLSWLRVIKYVGVIL